MSVHHLGIVELMMIVLEALNVQKSFMRSWLLDGRFLFQDLLASVARVLNGDRSLLDELGNARRALV